VTRIWIEHCEGDPREVYPKMSRVISLFKPPEFPKRFTDTELLEHLTWRCGSELDPGLLDPDGFLFGGVVYSLEK